MAMTTTDARELDARVAELMGYRVSWWSIHPVESFAELEGRSWRHTMSSLHATIRRDEEPGEVLLPDADGDMPALQMHDGHKWRGVPGYTTDIAADYEVLRHVRETWATDRQYQFANALAELYRTRNEGNHPILRYLPGDYSRAALAVMEEE